MDRLRADPAVPEILGRVSREIGFDLVQPPGCPPILFEEWDNPYFPTVTAGSIAARIYDLGRQCIPEDFADETSRAGRVAVFARMLQKGGTGGAREIALAVSGIAMDGDEAVQAVYPCLCFYRVRQNCLLRPVYRPSVEKEYPFLVRKLSIPKNTFRSKVYSALKQRQEQVLPSCFHK